ncbi:MAG: NAD(P)/FAD-dependent oxidoreductase [Candidatus Paceibacterota bacterium]
MSDSIHKPHILILGAGFGGVYVAKNLVEAAKSGQIEITIVNKTNYFLFTPLLHEVATGSLGPMSVSEPLQDIFGSQVVRIIEGQGIEVKSKEKEVTIKCNDNSFQESYDYLVVSTGAETNYYGITGAKENTLPLKTLTDALVIRRKIIDNIEKSDHESDLTKRQELLTFIVVGGGATGVELAAEIVEFAGDIMKASCKPNQGETGQCAIKVILIHAGQEILEQFPPNLRVAARARLENKGIEIKVATTVESVMPGSLRTKSGGEFKAQMIIWAAGVAPTLPAFDFNPVMAGSRIVTDSHLRLPDHPEIFLLGDIAAYSDSYTSVIPGAKASFVPMLAQAAVSEAKVVAANILASIENMPLQDFHFHSKGSLVSLGRWYAVGRIYSFNIYGRLSWWIWRTIYLFKFASNRKRLRIAFEWTLDLFYGRDITKLG